MNEGEAAQDRTGLGQVLGVMTIQNDSVQLGPELLHKCQTLLEELEKFEAYILQQKNDHEIELRHFKGSVKIECKLLEKVLSVHLFPSPTTPCKVNLR
jgi:hypothetical protein